MLALSALWRFDLDLPAVLSVDASPTGSCAAEIWSACRFFVDISLVLGLRGNTGFSMVF